MQAHMPPYTKQQPTDAYDGRGAGSPPWRPGHGFVDPVTKPAHYQRAGIETIDYIRATLDGPGFEAYCIGNVLKYVSRYREKGGIEDLRKAQVYLGWAIEPKPEDEVAKAPWPVDTTVREDVANEAHGSRYGVDWIYHDDRLGYLPAKPERIPKWDPRWADGQRDPISDYFAQAEVTAANLRAALNLPPNCVGLSARDVRAPHPMASETLRAEDEFDRDDKASGV